MSNQQPYFEPSYIWRYMLFVVGFINTLWSQKHNAVAWTRPNHENCDDCLPNQYVYLLNRIDFIIVKKRKLQQPSVTPLTFSHSPQAAPQDILLVLSGWNLNLTTSSCAASTLLEPRSPLPLRPAAAPHCSPCFHLCPSIFLNTAIIAVLLKYKPKQFSFLCKSNPWLLLVHRQCN